MFDQWWKEEGSVLASKSMIEIIASEAYHAGLQNGSPRSGFHAVSSNGDDFPDKLVFDSGATVEITENPAGGVYLKISGVDGQ